MKILLLEDDILLGESLKEYLELDGFDVEWAKDGEEVLELTFEKRFDLYVLDINVPQINGLELLRELREAGDETPAIYISALVDIESIGSGFEAGAVDYIKKPFDPEELSLRIRHRFADKKEPAHYKDMSFDPQTGVVRKDGETIHLGEVQKLIFALLLEKEGQVVSIDRLFDCMREPNHNALRVTISKMKKRLEIDIVNIRGEGYMLEKI